MSFAASLTLCVALPILMVLANKSAPLSLAVGCVLANLSVIVGGRIGALRGRYLDLLRGGSAFLIVAALCWAALSMIWTISPPMTIRGLRETLPELLFGWGLAAAWPMAARRRDLRWLGFGIVGATALIVFEAATHLVLHKLVGARAFPWDLKRSSIPVLLLLWPAFELFSSSSRRAMPVVLVVAAATGATVSHSSASVVAILLGLAIHALAQKFPKGALYGFGAVILLALASAPWTGTIMGTLVSQPIAHILEGQHAAERIVIWNAFENRVWERPWLGHGYDTSFRIADGWNLPGGRPIEKGIYNIHPHNQFLQIWIDFGAAGTVLMLAALALLMVNLSHVEPLRLAPRLACVVSAATMSLVGVQAWDAWWLATLAVCWAGFMVMGRDRQASGKACRKTVDQLRTVGSDVAKHRRLDAL